MASLFKIGAVTEGFQSNTTAQQVLSQLVNLTKPVVNNTQRAPEIFGGDLVIAVDILVTLADFNTLEGNVSTEEDVENFAQVSSNLLEPTNRITWQELDQVSINVDKICLLSSFFRGVPISWDGVLPHMDYIGMRGAKGYVFFEQFSQKQVYDFDQFGLK